MVCTADQRERERERRERMRERGGLHQSQCKIHPLVEHTHYQLCPSLCTNEDGCWSDWILAETLGLGGE